MKLRNDYIRGLLIYRVEIKTFQCFDLEDSIESIINPVDAYTPIFLRKIMSVSFNSRFYVSPTLSFYKRLGPIRPCSRHPQSRLISIRLE